MRFHAFSLLEALLVIAVIGVLALFSVSPYRTYQAHSNLNLATEEAMQGLARAKDLAQSGQKDSPWGFYVPSGTLYRGENYANRDPADDEIFPMPSTVAVSGDIFEVSYSRREGKPNATGTIVLTAVDGEQKSIVVTVAVQRQTVVVAPETTFVICHLPGPLQQEMTIIEADWPEHEAHGDVRGACSPISSLSSSSLSAAGGSSSASSAASSAPGGGGNSSSSFPQSSSSVGGGGGGSSSSSSYGLLICHKPGTHAQKTMTINPSAWNGHRVHGDVNGACGAGPSPLPEGCAGLFTLSDTGDITTTTTVDMKVTFLASQTTFGAGGPPIPLALSYTTDNNRWKNLFSGKSPQPGAEEAVSNIAVNSHAALRLHWFYKKNGWLLFDQTYDTNDGSDGIILLRSGDLLPSYLPFANQQSLRVILKDYLDAQNHLTIGATDVLVLGEAGTVAYPPPSTEDFQDGVAILHFAQHAGATCE